MSLPQLFTEIRTHGNCSGEVEGAGGVIQCDAFTSSPEAALKPLLFLHQYICQCLINCDVQTELLIHNTSMFFFV